MVQEKIVQGKKNNINIQAQNTNVPTDPSSVPLLNSSSLMPQENVIASQLTSYRIKTNTSEDVAGNLFFKLSFCFIKNAQNRVPIFHKMPFVQISSGF